MNAATNELALKGPLERLAREHAGWLPEARSLASVDAADGGARLHAYWLGTILPALRVEEDVLIPELAHRMSEADALLVFTLADRLALRQCARGLRPEKRCDRRAAAQAFVARLGALLEFEARTLWPALELTLGDELLAALSPELFPRPADGPQATHATPAQGRTS